MSLEDMTRQYAIRLPDGTLYGVPVYSAAMALFGLAPMGEDGEPAPEQLETQVYDTREQAEHQLEHMVKNAQRMGITSWLGRIETRYCTPFSDTDPAADMMADLDQFMREVGDDE